MVNLIFDIDGTLVKSTEFDTRLYLQAVADVLGTVKIHDDWDAYEHVTDSGILQQLLRENEIRDPVSAFDAVKSRFSALVEEHLEKEPCEPVPGTIEMLRQLARSEACRVGLATGGWRRTAIAKLESCAIDFQNIPLCSSDDAEARMEIMKLCLETMPATTGPVVYVGDGPWDLRASKGLGWKFVAIGDRLKGVHEPWFGDFEQLEDFERFDALLQEISPRA